MSERNSAEMTPRYFEAVSLCFQIKEHLGRLGELSRIKGDDGWWWPPTPFNRLTENELLGVALMRDVLPQTRSMFDCMQCGGEAQACAMKHGYRPKVRRAKKPSP